jgi:hypothetical protein
MNNHPISQKINRSMLKHMEEKVFENHPQYKSLIQTHGDTSYFQYSKQKNRLNLSKNFQERKKEFSGIIVQEVTRLLGTGIAKSVENQLKKNDSYSTAEHSAPISTANTLSSALHRAVPMFESNEPKMKNVIVLSCAGTSFSNQFSFARGHQFHAFNNNHITENQVTFFGRSLDSSTLLYSAPYFPDALTEMKKRLNQLTNEGLVQKIVTEKIIVLVDKIYASPHALLAKDYGDQVTITNYYLWKNIFSEYNDDDIPNYIMLSQEKLVLQLLLTYHLDQDTIIHRLLFSTQHHSLMEKYFANITGAFSEDQSWGTFLFWGLSQQDNTRFQLFRKEGYLVSKDGTFKLALQPDAIREAVMNKKIFPGLLLTFSLLLFYYGLRLSGGTRQPIYLTEMKNAFIKMLKEIDEEEFLSDVQESITDEIIFTRPHLAFIDAYGERVAATGFDSYLYQEPSAWKQIIEATKSISVSEFMTVLLPVLYKQLCPEDQQDEALLQITRRDVEKFTGFDKKISAIGIIK